MGSPAMSEASWPSSFPHFWKGGIELCLAPTGTEMTDPRLKEEFALHHEDKRKVFGDHLGASNGRLQCTALQGLPCPESLNPRN